MTAVSTAVYVRVHKMDTMNVHPSKFFFHLMNNIFFNSFYHVQQTNER